MSRSMAATHGHGLWGVPCGPLALFDFQPTAF